MSQDTKTIRKTTIKYPNDYTLDIRNSTISQETIEAVNNYINDILKKHSKLDKIHSSYMTFINSLDNKIKFNTYIESLKCIISLFNNLCNVLLYKDYKSYYDNIMKIDKLFSNNKKLSFIPIFGKGDYVYAIDNSCVQNFDDLDVSISKIDSYLYNDSDETLKDTIEILNSIIIIIGMLFKLVDVDELVEYNNSMLKNKQEIKREDIINDITKKFSSKFETLKCIQDLFSQDLKNTFICRRTKTMSKSSTKKPRKSNQNSQFNDTSINDIIISSNNEEKKNQELNFNIDEEKNISTLDNEMFSDDD